MRILLVDDSTCNNILLQNILEQEGYDVLTALQGNDALEILKTEKPDLILIDIMMPKMSGYELLYKILKNDKTKEIPAIMLSAKTDQENVQMALDLGAVDYIKKPVNISDLIGTINNVLGKNLH